MFIISKSSYLFHSPQALGLVLCLLVPLPQDLYLQRRGAEGNSFKKKYQKDDNKLQPNQYKVQQ